MMDKVNENSILLILPCIYLYSSYLYAICYFELALSNYNCQF